MPKYLGFLWPNTFLKVGKNPSMFGLFGQFFTKYPSTNPKFLNILDQWPKVGQKLRAHEGLDSLLFTGIIVRPSADYCSDFSVYVFKPKIR